MTLVMSYAILLAAAIGACSAALEGLLERKTPRRWIWASSLAVTVAATIMVMVWPAATTDSGVGRVVESSTLVLSEPTTSSLPATAHPASPDLLSVADAMLPFAWLFTSAGLLLAIAFGQRRLRRERLRATPAELVGHPALITEVIGPAVAGLRSPVVFVPQWVLALDEPSQRLLMAHEMEHVRKRDTAMLFAGALAAALVPWNPVVWWMVRRLRLAVEQDCDARVLAANPGVRRYADLLLLAASRHGLTTRLLAAHFGEHSSDLVRRIDTMTRQGAISWRRVVPATAIASLLLAAACETPRPAPVAPLELRNEVPAPEPEAAYAEIETSKSESGQFSVVVFSSDGEQIARYAGEIPVAHLPQDGVQHVKVDESSCGASKCYAVRITLKPGYQLNFTEIEKAKLPYKSSESASNLQEIRIPEIELLRDVSERIAMTNAKVRALDDSLVRFEGDVLADKIRNVADRIRTNVAPKPPEEATTQDNDKLVLYHLYDPNGTNRVVPPNVIVYNSDGSEHARFPSTSAALGSIELFGVENIKEQKTGECSPMACPLSRITLKPGYRLISYDDWKRRGK